MKLVKIENVTPSYSVREIMESRDQAGEDAFFWVDTYHADVTLNFVSGPVKFTNVLLYRFAQRMMYQIFNVNFYERDHNQIDVTAFANAIITVDVTEIGYDILIEPLYSYPIHYNNIQHTVNDPVLLQTSILEFNRICGALFENTLEIIDDKFEGIDGVQDFFGTIPFSEGFPWAWDDSY